MYLKAMLPPAINPLAAARRWMTQLSKRIVRSYSQPEEMDIFHVAVNFMAIWLGLFMTVTSIGLGFLYSDSLLPFFLIAGIWGFSGAIVPLVKRARRTDRIPTLFLASAFSMPLLFHAMFASEHHLIVFSAVVLGSHLILIRPERLGFRIATFVSVGLATLLCFLWQPASLAQLPLTRRDELLNVVEYFVISIMLLHLLVIPSVLSAADRQVRLASAQAEAEKEWALRAARAQRDFLANVSHEYRTPLTTLVMASQRLLRKPEVSKFSDEFIAVEAATLHLLALFNNSLDYTRYSDGRFKTRYSPVNLREHMENVRDTLLPQIESKSLSINIEVSDSVPQSFDCDPLLLRQLLLNLISNAVTYSTEGVIHVYADASLDAKTLHVEVSDNGPGIPDDKRELIFEPFQRGEGRDTSDSHSVGLGLAISKQIATLLGGDIGVRNADKGGAVFWFELPFSETHAVPQTEFHTSRTLLAGTASVLLVEDHAFNRHFLKEELERDGHTVKAAAGYDDALELLSHEVFDIVLTDMNLSDGTGIGLLTEARQNGIETPFVAITASFSAKDLEEYRLAGIEIVLTKPLSLAEFRAAVSWTRRD